MKTIKIIWWVSVFVIIFFNIAFDGYRIFDYLLNNYSKKEMVITDHSYNSSSRRRSITVFGTVDKRKVYFSRFDEDIDNLNNAYPEIFSEENKHFVMSVLKFKHSNIVMLIDDNELSRWKARLFFSGIYSLISILILLFLKK